MVALAALGSLVLKIKASGIGQATKGIKGFGKSFGKMNSKMKPALQGLKKGWLKMGAAAIGVLYKLQQASPRLAAKFEILNIRINQLLRSFGDALAPAVELVTNLIKDLTDWFKSLPQPVQDAITFGVAFATIIGVIVAALGAFLALFNPITMMFVGLVAAGAALHLAWQNNFLGIKDFVDFVFDAIKVAIDTVIGYFKGFGNKLIGFGENFINIFKGVIDFFKAVFTGDIEGAIAAVQSIFQNTFEAIASYILWPLTAMDDLIKAFQGSDFLNDMLKAGKAFIDAFVKGALQAIQDAGGIIEDLLSWLGDFFGGSLPERGPLKHIVTWGEDLGKAYIGGLDTGLQSSNISNVMTRNFNIDTVEVNAGGEDLDGLETFGNRLDDDLRRAISW